MSRSSKVGSPAIKVIVQRNGVTYGDEVVNGRILEDANTGKKECLVCGDVASGFHYGVASCEACKAFFKRTIQGNITYVCPANADCEINKRRRKSCQACRLKKCFEVGMLKEGVRPDRVRGGRQKYKRILIDPIESPVDEKRSRSFDSEFLSQLVNIEPGKQLAFPKKKVPIANRRGFDSALCDLMDREFISIIKWAKECPGFSNLPVSDQLQLIKSGILEIVALRLTYRSSPYGRERLVYADDLIVSRNDTHITDPPIKFDSSARELSQYLKCLELNLEEFVLIQVITLFNTDAKLLNDEEVQELRLQALTCLQEYVSSICDDRLRVANLLLVLPKLRTLKWYSRQFWLDMKARSEGNMPKLLLELIDEPADPS